MREFLCQEFGPVESWRDLLGIVLLVCGGLGLGAFGTAAWLTEICYAVSGVGAGTSAAAVLCGAWLRPGTEKAQWKFGVVGLLMAGMGVLVATDGAAGGAIATWFFGIGATFVLTLREPMLMSIGVGGFGGSDGGGGGDGGGGC